MIQWLQFPKCSVVSTFVECYWLIEKRKRAQSFEFPMLNPDPCGHLIMSPEDQSYSYNFGGNIECGFGDHILFPHLQTLQLDHSSPFIHLGIKFKVGAFYAIKIPGFGHPTLDQVAAVDLQALLAMSKLEVVDLLSLARKDSALCRDNLDNVLVRWLTQFHHDKYGELTSRVLKVIDIEPIARLGELLHCSQRTLERAFSKTTGFTLKQCQSMNRLEAMLEYLYSRSKEEIDWAEVACRFGFSDQPHLIRYLKSQLGLTPAKYAIDRGLTIDVYGGVSNYLHEST
ncbi:helix-turn-helix domain-containing protein [Pseudoalteromonas luteoviolacea]|uniref:helix-turn-helix domain-containing protein n=1 Tax=Pseudoalteromonas luteoviolacea TaxID=43657 RepID=UPI001B37BCF4|nr:helix-turn-helix domain-containing protein [Pseudoalteromonas luteoviolacea]MBQ4837859.1 AraC family transcriptional regulator [Pseudoalteromonas luteoviolacea]